MLQDKSKQKLVLNSFKYFCLLYFHISTVKHPTFTAAREQR